MCIVTSSKRQTEDYHELESDHEDALDYLNSKGYSPGQWIGQGAELTGLSGKVSREDFIHRTFGFHHREMTKIERAEGVHPDVERWAQIKLDKWKCQHERERIALREKKLSSRSISDKDRERLEAEIARIKEERVEILNKYEGSFKKLGEAEASAKQQALVILQPEESKKLLPGSGDPVGYTTALLKSKRSDLQNELADATGVGDKKRADRLAKEIERIEAKGKAFFDHADDVREFRREAERLEHEADRHSKESYRLDAEGRVAEANKARETAGEASAQAKKVETLLKDMPGAFAQGITLTTAMHKSLSLAQHVLPEDQARKLRECQAEANRELIESVGEKYGRARVVANGEVEYQKIRGLTSATFHHNDARMNRDAPEGSLPDPHEHLHNEIMKDVVTLDGKKASLDPALIYSNIKAIGAEGQARLAKRLLDSGFDLDLYSSEKGERTVGIAGFSDADIEQNSQRKKAINDSKGEGNDDQEAWADTRGKKYDEPGMLDGLWREKYKKQGLKADRANGTRKIELGQPEDGCGIPLPSTNDEEIIKRLTEREAYFSMSDIRKECWQATTELFVYVSSMKNQCEETGGDTYERLYKEACERMAKTEERIQRIANHPDLRGVSNEKLDSLFARNKKGEVYFMSKKMLEEEQANMQFFIELSKKREHALSEKDRRDIIAKLEREKTKELKQAGIDRPFKFRPDQIEAILHATDGRKFITISAKAGTGKTSSLSASIDIFEKQGKKVLLASSWNKATSQMATDTKKIRGKEVFTIAQLKLKVEDESVAIGKDHVILIDEAGLAGHREMTWLRETVERTGCSILLQGDESQTASVSAGKPFRRIVESNQVPVKTLVEFTRQREENQKRATMLASRGDFAEVIDIYKQAGMMHADHATTDSVVEQIAKDFVDCKDPLEQKIAITSKNADVDALNKSIREKLKEAGQLGESRTFKSKQSKRIVELAEGERICLSARLEKNETITNALLRAGKKAIRKQVRKATGVNLDTRVKKERVGEKSEFGTVTKVDNGGFWLKMDGQKKATYIKASECPELKLGYAATVSKLQGSTVESAFFMCSDFVNAALAYVGLSRHKKACHIYATRDQARTLASDMSRKELKIDAVDLVEDREVVEQAFKKPLDEIKKDIEEAKEIARDVVDGSKADRNIEETRKTLDATDESLKRAEEALARIEAVMKEAEAKRERTAVPAITEASGLSNAIVTQEKARACDIGKSRADITRYGEEPNKDGSPRVKPSKTKAERKAERDAEMATMTNEQKVARLNEELMSAFHRRDKEKIKELEAEFVEVASELYKQKQANEPKEEREAEKQAEGEKRKFENAIPEHDKLNRQAVESVKQTQTQAKTRDEVIEERLQMGTPVEKLIERGASPEEIIKNAPGDLPAEEVKKLIDGGLDVLSDEAQIFYAKATMDDGVEARKSLTLIDEAMDNAHIAKHEQEQQQAPQVATPTAQKTVAIKRR